MIKPVVELKNVMPVIPLRFVSPLFLSVLLDTLIHVSPPSAER